MIDMVHKGEGSVDGEWIINQYALQGYTLIGCQHGSGGLKDKPGKHPDIYHTHYSLLGHSICQSKSDDGFYKTGEEKSGSAVLSGHDHDRLQRMHPVYSVKIDKLKRACDELGTDYNNGV